MLISIELFGVIKSVGIKHSIIVPKYHHTMRRVVSIPFVNVAPRRVPLPSLLPYVHQTSVSLPSKSHQLRSLSSSSSSSSGPLTSGSTLSLPSLPLFERARTGASSGSPAIQSLADNRVFTYSHLLRDAALLGGKLRNVFASKRDAKWSAPSPLLANAEPRVVFLCEPSYEHVVMLFCTTTLPYMVWYLL
jgi:hypothetical protein